MHGTLPLSTASASTTTGAGVNSGETPVVVSGAPRAATPSVVRPRATNADPVPAQLRAAHRAQNWVQLSALARANPGHPSLDDSPHEGHTYLQLAAACGAADACSALLSCGASADAVDIRGSTALHLAAGAGHVNAVSALLAGGAELRLNNDGKTPLHDAAWAGHTNCVRVLVPIARKAGLLDAVGKDGRVALHCASLCTDPEIVDALLTAGANPDVVDQRGRTPLDWARDLTKASGDDTVAKHLQNAGAHASQDLDHLVKRND